ncbi:MAG: ParB/RepB/Spo0J family partition protein [Clostridia bacterium]|nr:ParB/RepB/Spo0J family partition protein [Clostridia bacterium]
MKESKKAVEKTAKKTDNITNDNTDIVNDTKSGTVADTKPEAVAEAKPDAAPKSKSLIIKLEDLEPFKDHPYKVIENESMIELTESIGAHGILNPLLVRPLEDSDGKYEIISGHRRFAAAQKLGMKKVPCTVHFIDRDAATVMMVDSNCQRTELLPSEKAKAYKMKMDAMAHQGQTCGPVGHKSRDEVSETESGRTVQRYIRLTYLVPELLQYVDDGKIGMRPAVEMSYLDEEVQRDIVDRIDESGGEVFPSHAQTRRIREKASEGEISYDDVKAIMDEQKPNQAPTFKVPENIVFEITKRRFTPKDFEEYLKKALTNYARQLEKEHNRDAR